MVNTAFQDWRRECEAVQKEMDRLIAAGRPQSPEERQVRQLQFSALIERRDAAAPRPHRRRRKQQVCRDGRIRFPKGDPMPAQAAPCTKLFGNPFFGCG